VSTTKERLAALEAENANLRARLEALEGRKRPAPKPAPVEERGVTVSYPRPPSTLIMPSDNELRQLEAIVLKAFPSLAPKIELNFQQRFTVRNYPAIADQIQPDAEAINADYFRQFTSAFVAIGAMRLRDEPARKYFVGHWTEAAQTWLRCRNVFADITTNALIAAALAHGVSYTDGTIDGSLWEFGLDLYTGRAVLDGWRRVLASGKIPQATPVPSNRRIAPASPARIYGR
jgi:hypothetical protein